MLDEGDWLCLQCGTYYYNGLYSQNGLARWPHRDVKPPHQEKALIFDRIAAGCSGERAVDPSQSNQYKLPQTGSLDVPLVSRLAAYDPMAL